MRRVKACPVSRLHGTTLPRRHTISLTAVAVANVPVVAGLTGIEDPVAAEALHPIEEQRPRWRRVEPERLFRRPQHVGSIEHRRGIGGA